MSITKEKKKEIFKAVSDLVDTSKSVVFVGYDKLTVKEVTELRRALKSQDVSYRVVKKSIAKKLLGEKKIEGTLPELGGQLGLAYSKDLVAPAREIFQFEKKFDKKVSILGGIFEGRYMNQSEMVTIASIPSLQTLYGQLVNLINSPIQGLVIALDAVAGKKN